MVRQPATHAFSASRALNNASLPKEEAWQGSDWESIGHALDGSGHVETSLALGRAKTEHG